MQDLLSHLAQFDPADGSIMYLRHIGYTAHIRTVEACSPESDS